MGLGYRVIDRNSVTSKMVFGSIPGEYLFWNELAVEASCISLSKLLRPSPYGKLWTPGLLDLIPQFQLQPPKGITKLTTPDPETGKEWDDRLTPEAAWKHFKKFYGVKMIKAGNTVDFEYTRPANPQDEIPIEKVWEHQKLVEGFKSEFRLPVLLAFLSMHFKAYHHEGITEVVRQVYAGKSGSYYMNND
jgi:hypothetical protein